MKRLFIANRGEISRRIAQTARRMGIETVCITDRRVPPHFLQGLITDFIFVEEESTALYLNAEMMVDLALHAKCDSLHPGFGFLSENFQFAQKVTDAGMLWVGPSPEAIYAMADKGRARKLAQKAGVPCTVGLEGFRLTEGSKGELATFTAKAGYPLLLKAALGGGGKGMRIVTRGEDLIPLVQRVQSEALSSFGDDSLIIEQYIPKSRHVEVQVFGDQSGQIVIFGDRDCSLQRRHQKVLEEAPAPELSTITRDKLHEAARRLAKEVGYTSAGTVEFLVAWEDKDKSASEQNFYFLEMNTRLQVEHPVTEEVFGVDLVEWQLRVARGERLPTEAQDWKPRGHSIEARIYAEDVPNGFLPAPGPIYGFIPKHLAGIRWETGLDIVDEITPKFDPMIAKVVATGQTRKIAMARLYQALEQSFMAGPPNNREFVMALVSETPFVEGPLCTDYLGQAREGILSQWNAKKLACENFLDTLWPLIRNASNPSSGLSGSSSNSYSVTDALGHIFGGTQALRRSEQEAPGSGIAFSLSKPRMGESHLVCEGRVLRPDQSGLESFAYARATVKGKELEFLLWNGFDFYKETTPGFHGQTATSDHGSDNGLKAPVPGKVVKILVEAGQEVTQGQTCLVLESMKMEFEIKSGAPKKIKSILAVVGKQVDGEEILLTFEEAQEC